MTEQTDPHGLTSAERKLLDCYEHLTHVLREEHQNLAPFAERNAIKALSALWQVVNGLDLKPGQPYDLGA